MFKLGQIVVTREVNDEIPQDEIKNLFNRYAKKDWGILNQEDKKMNDEAIKNDDDRILARYNTSTGRDVYIITEWDRSYTTMLYADRY